MANIYPLPSTERLADRVVSEVRAWRGRLNLTQSELGRIIGVGQTGISDRMRGKMEFSLTEIESLAVAFGIDPVELMPPPRKTERRDPLSSTTTAENLAVLWLPVRPAA